MTEMLNRDDNAGDPDIQASVYMSAMHRLSKQAISTTAKNSPDRSTLVAEIYQNVAQGRAQVKRQYASTSLVSKQYWLKNKK